MRNVHVPAVYSVVIDTLSQLHILCQNVTVYVTTSVTVYVTITVTVYVILIVMVYVILTWYNLYDTHCLD